MTDIPHYKTTKIDDSWRPSCPFCHAPWTDDMITMEVVQGGSGCDTCGWGSQATAKVEIHCAGCKRLIYVKEGESDYF